ncbi:Dyp-type peroxidase [Otariodibacter oris]|uniref:Putative iron-dependent peroxidase n=1 Tax=Otariodibacter oris TaxID=1032623 RepID=A0A420XEV8_9PAST|nr:Dyp-type peroxidase [Otariodibacter oris]QGM80201.1 peroxidase [Otariodibacter oris]RKR70610.1 putative iron-dependent peroxidase [Otariodibacter oris]
MTTAQSGITLMHRKSGIFIELTINDSTKLADRIKTIYEQFEETKQKFSVDELGITFAFGESLWRKLAPKSSALELKSFTSLGSEEREFAPATQRDLLVHIQSDRPDVNFAVALIVVEQLQDIATVEEEINGFRWIEDRDLTGFIDGTENPENEEKLREVALINEGEDEGGSYVLSQRYVHQLQKWNKMSSDRQEQVIGRTKADSVELDDVPSNSHVGRVDLKENGKGLKVLRHSLPYGKASGENGLYFLAFSKRLYNIDQQLKSMFGELDGKTDRLLGFTKAVTSSYYFAPSLEILLNL